jgi:uncharacterized protein YgiM (DUF1202 family)
VRQIAVALLVVTCVLLASAGSMTAGATQAPDNTSTGSAPVATSFIYPVGVATSEPAWMPDNANGYFITQGFNTSCDPSLGQGFYMYGLYYCGHTGVDLASSSADATVHATAAGVVVEAGYYDSFGVMVRIQHLLPDGSYVYSQYEHMAYGSLAVYAGQIVSQGQELGLVGATGFATGAHLHFEIKSVNEDGVGYTFGNDALIQGYYDPLAFVAQHQVVFQPASLVTNTGHAVVPVWPAESDAILQTFLKSYAHFVVVSVGDGLNVRSGPGLHYKVLGTVLRGAKLGYLSTQGAWLKVALPQHVQGWVDKKYVTGYQDWDPQSLKSVTTSAWPPPGPLLTVQVVGLNVRSAPGQSHSIVTAVFQGDKLALLSLTTNWAYVLTRDGTKGWVMRQYVRQAGQSSGSTVAFAVVNTPILRVRTGPGTQYSVSGTVFSGTHMQIVRSTPHWDAVILPGGTTGWVARPYVRDPGPGHTHAAPSQHPSQAGQSAAFVTVATAILNVRSGPGVNHAIVARVRAKTSLQVLGLTAHWAHIALPASQIDGWVLRSLTR